MKHFMQALAISIKVAFAQASSPWYDVQSSAFRLALKSDNDTLNGYVLGACHQGAAIEGLCLTGETIADLATPYTTFYHNVSSSKNELSNAIDTLGVLNYVLRAGANLDVPSAMGFYYNPGSNLADLIFSPGYDDYTLVAFEGNQPCSSMYILVYEDTTVSPPAYYEPPLKLKNWYICLTRFSYLYTTLVFKVGVTEMPQNPTCAKVEVERVWL